MKARKFLVPVATAIAALGATEGHAMSTPSAIVSQQPAADAANTDQVIQRLTYQVGDENHSLLMRKPAAGEVYAYHESHSSHASHGSHRSHRSGG